MENSTTKDIQLLGLNMSPEARVKTIVVEIASTAIHDTYLNLDRTGQSLMRELRPTLDACRLVERNGDANKYRRIYSAVQWLLATERDAQEDFEQADEANKG